MIKAITWIIQYFYEDYSYLFDLSSEGIALCVDINLCHC